jgi:IMP dehydrogenase
MHVRECICLPCALFTVRYLVHPTCVRAPTLLLIGRRGMGSLEAMKKGSETRYHSDTQTIKIAQGVSGTVGDKGSVRGIVPFLTQAARQGFQDLGSSSIERARERLYDGSQRLEARTNAALKEGGVHDMHSYVKQSW